MGRATVDMILGGLALAFLWACARYKQEQMRHEAERAILRKIHQTVGS